MRRQCGIWRQAWYNYGATPARWRPTRGLCSRGASITCVRDHAASMSQKTVVIVPTYNEKDNLPALAQRVMGLPVPVDMLVVDDHSPDGTGELADELARKNPPLHVLPRVEKNS